MRQAQRPLTPAWVAGSVRARNMLVRRIGAEQARALAHEPTLRAGIAMLAGTSYGRFVRPGMDLAEAQRAIAETALWHVRVLAGWMPPRGLEPVRALAAWFELVSIEDRLAYMAGAQAPSPFALGGLATVGTLIAAAQNEAELRQALSGSLWGDPGGDDRVTIGLALRFSWARRVIESVPEATDWASGAVALLLARELFLAGRSADSLIARKPPGVGAQWSRASDMQSFRALLPAQAAWALAELDTPSDLWRAETLWWQRVEEEAGRLAFDPHLGRPAVVGSVALLGVDAWRTAAALASAARGAAGTFDEIG